MLKETADHPPFSKRNEKRHLNFSRLLRMRGLKWIVGASILCLFIFGLWIIRKTDLFKSGSSPSQPIFDPAEMASAALTVPVTSTLVGGPLRVSPTNPRYFSDANGNIVYLSGSHTWLNFQDGGVSIPIQTTFDYDTYLNVLVSHHHNFFRLWVWEESYETIPGSPKVWFEPHIYKNAGTASAPKYDLTSLNQAYFDRLRARVSAAGQKGMYVSIMLFNGWSVETKDNQHDPWPGHPYNKKNNLNGINGDPNGDGLGREVHSLQIKDINAYQKAYLHKVIDTVNDLDNVLFEISNESDSGSTAWQYEMINEIKRYESQKPKQHPVGMTVSYPNGSNAALLDSPADWVSPNGDVESPMVGDGQKVILNDTDHLCGTCGSRQWVWKSLTRGLNPIFMDPYDSFMSGVDISDPKWEDIRRSLGYALQYANRISLARMTPHGDLSSSGYALANLDGKNSEFLIYLPNSRDVNLNLTAVSGEFGVEWFNPVNGSKSAGSKTSGGSNQSFHSPFDNDSVLYLYPYNPSSTYLPDIMLIP